jgi:hypothetical protein
LPQYRHGALHVAVDYQIKHETARPAMRLDLEWLMPKFDANRLDVYRGHRGHLLAYP